MPTEPSRSSKKANTGAWFAIVREARLIGNLLLDKRVPWYLKLLPVGAVIYALSPVDLMPLNPLDDAAIVSAAFYFFLELTPPEIVAEYREKASPTVIPGAWRDAGEDENA